MDKMKKTRMCHVVIAIIIVTMGTSLMIVYSSSYGDTSSYHSDAGRPSTQKPRNSPKPQRHLPSLLEGYTGVVDHKPLKMHCNCCAVVTSSGHLTGSRLGHEIDRSECVIRMNDAPVSGYQRDVGGHTSLRVVAHSSLQRVLRSQQELLNTSQDTVFLFWGPSSSMRQDGKGAVYNNLRLVNQLLPTLNIYVLSRLKMFRFDELFKKETGIDRRSSKSWLSTGWFTMAIALELCDQVNVYGMVPPDYCGLPSHPNVPYHYYEPSGPGECSMYLSHEGSRCGSHHRFITEKTVFANWAQQFDIRFYQPEWEPSAFHANRSHIPEPFGS
ncbi:alpha-N-acetylgalactosaminide alpha-2,6-sialyltransferase 5-like [Aplochiton taeniatus]